ncbi:sensor histidine kinase [Streptomyces alboflavus]|uniref:sensor histidine kinase n=1 Tax=Streptomyces alboflavus TaxID=67267 RepID=UPI00068AC534|nr:histidine kinase [Streptomyces alboflavus]
MGRGAVRGWPGAADAAVPAVLLMGHVLALVLSGVLTGSDGGGDGGAAGEVVPQVLVGVFALGVAAVSLVWRRVAPLPVFGVALLADGSAEALLPRAALTPALPCALWVALFSLAAHGSARRVLGAAALATAVLPLHGIPVPGTGEGAEDDTGADTGTDTGTDTGADTGFGAGLDTPGPLLDSLVAGALLHLLIVLCGTLRRHRTARRAQVLTRLAAVERERRAAAHAERERLARDLHDAAGHHLTAVAVQSAAALRLAGTRPELAAEALTSAAATGRDVLASLGRIVAVVGDGTDASGAPHESVPDLCAGLEHLGLPVTRTTEGRPRPLPGDISVAAYRIVQESLTNAMRYAAGAPVAVCLRYGAGELTVTVVNERPTAGPAADGGAPSGTGRGLAGMRERVHGVGGVLSAGPTSAGGWGVEATLPVPGARPRVRAMVMDAVLYVLCAALPLLLSCVGPAPLLSGPTLPELAVLAGLLSVHAAPLLLRRRAPVTALAAMLTTTLGWSAAAAFGPLDSDWLGPLALAWTAELAALHAVAAYGPPRVTWPAPVAVGVVGGVAVGLAVAGDPGESAGPGAVALLAALGLAAVPWLLPVWALGLLTRARRGEGGPWERRVLDRVAARVGEAVAGERRRVAAGLHAAVVGHTVALVRHAEAGLGGAVAVRTALTEVTGGARAALAGLRELLDALDEPDAPAPTGPACESAPTPVSVPDPMPTTRTPTTKEAAT